MEYGSVMYPIDLPMICGINDLSFMVFSAASLFSECHGSSDCRAENTACLSGYCVCQQGFHVMEMQCSESTNLY